VVLNLEAQAYARLGRVGREAHSQAESLTVVCILLEILRVYYDLISQKVNKSGRIYLATMDFQLIQHTKNSQNLTHRNCCDLTPSLSYYVKPSTL
jgi:hypothetical protein